MILVGHIIGLICCLLCALPFFVLAAFGKDSDEPINFWSGDTTLKSKVRDVKGYNKEMSALYNQYGAAFVIAGLGCLILPVTGVILIGLNSTLGLYLVYRKYRKILQMYERG